MSDTENTRWCPACKRESLDGDERFCANCCKVLDKLFPDGAWHNMETEDLVEHYHCGLDSVDAAEAGGIPPVADMNAPKKEGVEGFWEEWGAIIVVAAVVVIGLLIWLFL